MPNLIELIKTIVIFCVFLKQGFCYLDVKRKYQVVYKFLSESFSLIFQTSFFYQTLRFSGRFKIVQFFFYLKIKNCIWSQFEYV